MSPQMTETSTEIRAPETEKSVRPMRTAVSFAGPLFTCRASPRCGEVAQFRSAGCSASARVRERPQLLKLGQRLWGVACESVNFQPAQDAILFKDENTAELVLLAEDEVGDWVNARRRSGLALDPKIDAGTTT